MGNRVILAMKSKTVEKRGGEKPVLWRGSEEGGSESSAKFKKWKKKTADLERQGEENTRLSQLGKIRSRLYSVVV